MTDPFPTPINQIEENIQQNEAAAAGRFSSNAAGLLRTPKSEAHGMKQVSLFPEARNFK
jgi:hypothetical protein